MLLWLELGRDEEAVYLIALRMNVLIVPWHGYNWNIFTRTMCGNMNYLCVIDHNFFLRQINLT